MASVVEIVILGIDAIVLPILYYSYRKDCKKLKNIENAKEINLNDSKINKSLEKTNDYVLISGEVQPKNIALQSNYSKQHSGVIKVISIKKHGTSWRHSPFGEDFSKDLSSTVSSEPFYLANKKSNAKIEIINGEKADFILKELDTTHKQYDPSDSLIFTTLVSRIFSTDVTNGIELTEKMLKNGSFLYAFGRLEKISDNSYYLIRPVNTDFPFILTKQTRELVANDFKETISVLKFFLILFGSIGVITGGYCLYKYYKIYKEKKLRDRMAATFREERIRLQRERLQNNPNDNNNNHNVEQAQTCVLCLVNQREIILLDCGHFCICIECLDRLPNQNCPVCRQEYQSYARCYVP